MLSLWKACPRAIQCPNKEGGRGLRRWVKSWWWTGTRRNWRRQTPWWSWRWEKPGCNFDWRAGQNPGTDWQRQNQGEWSIWQSRETNGPGRHQWPGRWSCWLTGLRWRWGDDGRNEDDREAEGKEKLSGDEESRSSCRPGSPWWKQSDDWLRLIRRDKGAQRSYLRDKVGN